MTDNENGNRIKEMRDLYQTRLDEARQVLQRVGIEATRLEGALLALKELEKDEPEDTQVDSEM